MTSPRDSASKIRVCKIEVNNENAMEKQKRYEEWLRNKRYSNFYGRWPIYIKTDSRKLARDRKLQFKASEEREEKENAIKRQKSREKVLEWMSKKSVGSCSSKKSDTDVCSGKVKTLRVNTKSEQELNFDAWLKKKEKQEIG